MTNQCKLIAIAVLLATSPAWTQQTQKDAAMVKTASAANPTPTSDVAQSGYIIGPEDVLHINVWKEADFSAATIPVRPDGKISLPLIDDVRAAGLTPMELAALITQRLRQYVTEPRVTVTVASVNSRRIYIVGQVARAGQFPLLSEMTVLQALSTAGGLTPFAAAKKIYILRQEKGKQVKLPFNYKDVIRGRSQEQNIVLRSGDTIVVP